MRTDRRFLVAVAVSLIWGLIVAAVFYRIASGSRRARPPAPEKPLVVAVQALPLGAMLARDSVKIRSVPEGLYPAGGFARIEDVVDRPVIAAIQPDEPVLEARLGARGSGLGLAPMIPPGMRAISVRVNDVAGVAGFVLPGMKVDVLVTGHAPGRDETVTRTVLQNVVVLSAGQTIETDAKSQPINTPVVTLLVSPADAESLTLATSEGHIQLVLRNSSDQQVAATTGRHLAELFGSVPATAPPEVGRVRRNVTVASAPAPVPKSPPAPQPPPAAVPVPTPPPPPPPPAAAQETVMLIRGTVKTEEPIASKAGAAK
jgi:pilus assembly protein CpaB